MSSAWIAILVGAILVLAGCSHPLDAAVATANAAALSLKAAHGTIGDASRSDQREAANRVQGDRSDPAVIAEQLDRAREAGAKYRPVWNAYNSAVCAWYSAVEAIQAAQAAEEAGAEPDMQRIGALLTALAQSLKSLEEARQWLTR